jgi:hypothetical protein
MNNATIPVMTMEQEARHLYSQIGRLADFLQLRIDGIFDGAANEAIRLIARQETDIFILQQEVKDLNLKLENK